MPTSYPGALDAFTNPTSGDVLTSPSHAGQHANANDAIEAIETELGVIPSGTEVDVATRLDKLPRGLLAEAKSTANQGSIGAAQVDLTGLSVTVTIPDNTRRIKITAEGKFNATAAERAGLRIIEGAVQFQQGVEAVDAGQPITVHTEVILNPTSGPHTYKLAAISLTGAAFLTLNASSTAPALILVEDLGKV